MQGSHSILKLKIEENRGDLRRNFVKFEDNLEKNRGELRRFFLHFQTKPRKIEEIFQSMRNGAFTIEAFNITVFL